MRGQFTTRVGVATSPPLGGSESTPKRPPRSSDPSRLASRPAVRGCGRFRPKTSRRKCAEHP